MKVRLSKKAQVAIEFVILTGFLLFFFVLFFLAIQENMSDKTREKQDLVVKETALTIKSEIELAHESINGYYREFTIPQKILNLDYEASFVDGLIYIKTSDNKHTIALTVLPVNGSIIKGKNIIRKQEGVVYLNE